MTSRELSDAVLGWAPRLPARPGVVQVASVWQPPCGGPLRVLRIGPDAPESVGDRTLLGLARARADAIILTGAILRAEPSLTLALGDPRLEAVRRRGGHQHPKVVVLTRRGPLPAAHPIFHHAITIHASEDGARELAAGPSGPDVVPFQEPSLAASVRTLRDAGFGAVLIEAGPTASRPLLATPGAVDELMLGTFLGPSLPEAAVGEPLLERGEIDARFEPAEVPVDLEEPSGPWRFERLTRRRGQN